MYNSRLMRRLLVLFLAPAIVAACSNGATDSEVVRGRQLFAEHCVACHSLNPEVVIVGPSLAGVATRVATSSGGQETREVLRRSILSPQDEITDGFENLMPPDFEQKLNEADLEALLSYLLTLE